MISRRGSGDSARRLAATLRAGAKRVAPGPVLAPELGLVPVLAPELELVPGPVLVPAGRLPPPGPGRRP
jgi:hypothetical protein